MKLKLSEAIMLNGMSKPQGYGCESVASIDAPCAIGGALQTVGKQVTFDPSANYPIFFQEWPWVDQEAPEFCPACMDEIWRVADAIWHLNDLHRWSRQQIAEWVSTIEPQEPEQTELVEVAEVVND